MCVPGAFDLPAGTDRELVAVLIVSAFYGRQWSQSVATTPTTTTRAHLIAIWKLRTSPDCRLHPASSTQLQSDAT